MALKKNVAGQKIIVYAYDLDNETGKTGDAANITASISKDGGAFAATNDTNPTEIGLGSYAFDLTQSETNADLVFLVASSSTANIQINPVSNYTDSAVSISTWSGTPNQTIWQLVIAQGDIAGDVANEEDSEVTDELSALISLAQDFVTTTCNLGRFPTLSQGYSKSAASAETDISGLAENELRVSVDNGESWATLELTLANCTTGATTAAELQTQIRAAAPSSPNHLWDNATVSFDSGTSVYTITSAIYGDQSRIQIGFTTDKYHVAEALKLTPLYGGEEQPGTVRDEIIESITAQTAIDAYRNVKQSPESYSAEADKAALVAMAFRAMGKTANNLKLSRRKL